LSGLPCAVTGNLLCDYSRAPFRRRKKFQMFSHLYPRSLSVGFSDKFVFPLLHQETGKLGSNLHWRYNSPRVESINKPMFWGQKKSTLNHSLILKYDDDLCRSKLGSIRMKTRLGTRSTRTTRVVRFSTFGGFLLWETKGIVKIELFNAHSGPSLKEELSMQAHDFLGSRAFSIPVESRAPFQPRVWSEQTWGIFRALEASL